MTVEILVPRRWSSKDVLRSYEQPGKPSGKVPGSWISDNVATHKAICLCPFCLPKFNPRAHRYEVWRRHTYVRAKCNGCDKVDLHCVMFIPQAFHDAVGEWSRPKPGRWAQTVSRWLGTTTPWASR